METWFRTLARYTHLQNVSVACHLDGSSSPITISIDARHALVVVVVASPLGQMQY